MRLRTCVVSLMLAPDELERLDDWRLQNRMWSRSEAIRTAIRHFLPDSPSRAATTEQLVEAD